MSNQTQTRPEVSVNRVRLATGAALLLVALVMPAGLLALAPLAAAAQIPQPPSKTVQVQGRVVGPDGIGLPGATVAGNSILSTRAATTATDAEGRYTFEVLVFRGVLTITVTLPGFGNAGLTRYDVPDELTVDVTLRPAFETQISVGADIPMLSAAGGVGELTLTPSQSAVLPGLGSRDLLRTCQLLPGVSGSNETSSGLFVRGGTPDQNAIWFDGFRVYHVDHLFGYSASPAFKRRHFPRTRIDARS